MKQAVKSVAGITMIEIIVSLALIAVVIISFIPLFVASAKNDSRTDVTLSSTYLGKDAMELAYYLSKNVYFENLDEELISRGYSYDSDNSIFAYENQDNKYTTMKYNQEGNLIRVIVKVYKDKKMTQLEAQFESLYSWKGRGILSEE